MRSIPIPTVLLTGFKCSSPRKAYLLFSLFWTSSLIYTKSNPTSFLSCATLLIIWQLYLWVNPPLKIVPVEDTIEGSTASISNEMWNGLYPFGSRYSMAWRMTYPIPNLSTWSIVKHFTFFYFKDTHSSLSMSLIPMRTKFSIGSFSFNH